jgi:hypothetical protein
MYLAKLPSQSRPAPATFGFRTPAIKALLNAFKGATAPANRALADRHN